MIERGRGVTHPLLTFDVEVAYTTRRPVVPDERTAWVRVVEVDDVDASLLAAQIVGATRGVVMVTRSRVLDCVA